MEYEKILIAKVVTRLSDGIIARTEFFRDRELNPLEFKTQKEAFGYLLNKTEFETTGAFRHLHVESTSISYQDDTYYYAYRLIFI